MTMHVGGVFRLAVLVGLLGSVASAAFAQTGACSSSAAPVVNPNGWVCVTPGAGYTAVHPDPPIAGVTSVPLVVRLELLLFGPSVTNTATGAPSLTVSLGKPALNAQGAVWAQVPAVTQIPVGQVYKARAIAVGQPAEAGQPAQVSGRSPESNPFVRLAATPAPTAPTAVAVPGS